MKGMCMSVNISHWITVGTYTAIYMDCWTN